MKSKHKPPNIKATKERRRAHDLPFKSQPKPLDNRFLDETIAFWQPQSSRPLDREDARQMIENVTGFFTVLREWAECDQRRSALKKPINEQPKICVAVDSRSRQTHGEQ